MRLRHLPLWAFLLLAAPVAAETVLEDPEGDVALSAYGASAPASAPAVDLLRLEVQEQDYALVLGVTVAGEPRAPPDAAVDDSAIAVSFRHGGHGYVIQLDHADGASRAILHAVTGPGAVLHTVARLSHQVEETTWRVVLPRDQARDEQGAPLLAGQRLEDVQVVAVGRTHADGPDPDEGLYCCTRAVEVVDRMPDRGGDAGMYPVASGGRSREGPVELAAAQPFRATNAGGGVRFLLQARNLGTESLEPTLALEGLPNGWSAAVEAPPIPAGTTRNVTVVVQAPFAHHHGRTTAFHAVLEDPDAGARAEVLLGVHVLEVPQPAGHHPVLHLHARAESPQWDPLLRAAGYRPGLIWMNTLEEDSDDEALAVDSTQSSWMGEASRWSVCLVPGPALPLWFQPGLEGGLDVRLEATRPYGNVSLNGALVRFGPGDAADPCDAQALREAGREEELLATIPATEPATLDGPTRFTAPLVPRLQEVPHVPGAVLLLELEATYPVPDSQGPGPIALLPGGRLALPLREVQEAPEPVAPQPAPTTAPADVADGADTGSAPPPGPARETPWPPVALLLVLLAIAWRRRAGPAPS